MAWSYPELFPSLMKILREAIKLPRRNKTIFIIIIISTIITCSLLYSADIFSLVPIISKLSLDISSLLSMKPMSPEYIEQFLKIKKETVHFLLIDTTYFLLISMASLLTMVSTVCVSDMSVLGKDLTLMELLSKLTHIWVRLLLTWFSFFLITAGLIFLITAGLIFLIRGSIFILSFGIVLYLIVFAVYLSFSLLSMTSIVVSVLEDCYGLQALGTAEKLIKERKVAAFVLCFLLVVPLIVVYIGVVLANKHQTLVIGLLISGAVMYVGIFVNMLSMIAYTVFYFDSKQINGEQVDFEDGMQYTRISTVPINDLALP